MALGRSFFIAHRRKKATNAENGGDFDSVYI